MGGHPYFYFVKHQPNIDAALRELRQREFQAGRYNPAVPFPEFPVGPESPAPGAQHDSIEDAVADSDADGTRSILDINHISEEPDYCAAAPLPEEELLRLFDTEKPTREMIEENEELFE